LEEDVASPVEEVPAALEAEATPWVEEREFVALEVAALGEDAIVDVAAFSVMKVKEEAAPVDDEVAAPVEDAAAVSGDAA
jgi:hypothetical protein